MKSSIKSVILELSLREMVLLRGILGMGTPNSCMNVFNSSSVRLHPNLPHDLKAETTCEEIDALSNALCKAFGDIYKPQA